MNFIKKNLKIIIDILMLISLIILMCEHNIISSIHEIVGIIIFLLFIIHNLLNYKWYKLIFSGKINKKMIPRIVLNLLILIFLILTMLSGIMISGYLFKNLFRNPMLGRSLHMVSSIWLFILISVHLGIHLNKMLYKLKNEILFKIIEVFLILIGLIIMIFIDRIYEEMFYLTSFKNYDAINIFLDILKKLLTSISISLLSFNVLKFLRRNKNAKKI